MANEKNTRLTLLQKLQKPDNENSWDDFVKYYEGYIYVVIRNFGFDSEDSEDLLQDVLVKVWKALPKYNYQQGKCRFRTWLCVIIRNTVFNFYDLRVNKNKAKNVSLSHTLNELEMISEAEIDKLAKREWENYVSNMAWENLKKDFSEISRQVFEASLDEDNNSLIAARFTIPESSVRVYKMRVRKALLKEIVRLNQELGG
ncbi:MAG: RNA polymerase sigma factor [Lentisphaeraceae bacterium]|nr:RNA polymerase sigma factor [Lentisphaeraceae bacterium]